MAKTWQQQLFALDLTETVKGKASALLEGMPDARRKDILVDDQEVAKAAVLQYLSDVEEEEIQFLVDTGVLVRRITGQELLKQPLPVMRYISQPKVTTTQEYKAYPSSVAVWDLDEGAILAAAACADSDTRGALFLPLEGYSSVVMSCELGVQQHLHNMLERLNTISNHTGANKQQWMSPAATCLLEQVASGLDLAAAADAKVIDEVLCSMDGCILASLEVKRPEVLASVGTDSLAAPRVAGTPSVLSTISQVTSYAAARGLRYCVVSTYMMTWLMKYDDNHVLHVTKGLPFDSQGPTVLQGLWWLMTLARGGGSGSQPWTPALAPPWMDGTIAESGIGAGGPILCSVRAQSGAISADAAPSSFAVGQQVEAAQAVIDSDGGSGSPCTAAWQLTDLTDVSWLGHGMTGAVYSGRLGSIMVAVKITQDARGIKRLQHEVDIYRHLQPLQGDCIPQLVAYGRSPHGRSFWIATELFAGQHLDPSSDSAHRTRDVHLAARACLMSIHAAGVLHGDVHSANILVNTSSQRVQFVDLGLAQVLGPPPGKACDGSGGGGSGVIDSSSEGASGGASSLIEQGKFTSELDELDSLFWLQGASCSPSATAAPLAVSPAATSTLDSNSGRGNVRMASVYGHVYRHGELRASGSWRAAAPGRTQVLMPVQVRTAAERDTGSGHVTAARARPVVGGRYAQPAHLHLRF